ncbi:hypothetical protein BRADI_5g08980v3 [Brachypodium distachyon]|uniref:Myb/SANT-like DNA-binding domain-containing protein n=1 Tax=Brachypodium distachyon TaxID=15368 RepID=A0A2K2CG48_BRADI|nr:hypothetical protein BRADI_5g08980v3 [Brachypodium distachyon]
MASCDDDFGLLGDDAHPAPQPSAQPPPPQQAQTFCFVDAPATGSGSGPFVPAQEEGNHSSERGKASHHSKRRRERAEEFSDGGEYCSYISSSAGGRKGRGGGGGGSSDYRKDREEWTDGAISSLLDAYTERFEQLNRGNLRGRDWEDVAAAVTDGQGKGGAGKSVEQCKNKIDNLKKRYKVECTRNGGAGAASVSHWPWYRQMEQIIGNSSSPGTSKPLAPTNDEKPRQLLQNANKRYPSSGTGPPTMVPCSRLTPLSNPKWKRVLLKIGGTALAGEAPHNVDPKVIMLIAREVQVACRHGVENDGSSDECSIASSITRKNRCGDTSPDCTDDARGSRTIHKKASHAPSSKRKGSYLWWNWCLHRKSTFHNRYRCCTESF